MSINKIFLYTIIVILIEFLYLCIKYITNSEKNELEDLIKDKEILHNKNFIMLIQSLIT